MVEVYIVCQIFPLENNHKIVARQDIVDIVRILISNTLLKKKKIPIAMAIILRNNKFLFFCFSVLETLCLSLLWVLHGRAY